MNQPNEKLKERIEELESDKQDMLDKLDAIRDIFKDSDEETLRPPVNCEDCRYWRRAIDSARAEIPDNCGICTRYPPRLIVGPTDPVKPDKGPLVSTAFPLTFNSQGCGEGVNRYRNWN